MIYLDGDVQMYGNCDELFDLPDGYIYGVMDCFCEWYHSPQFKIGYCQQCPERVKWPADMGPPLLRYFNAGMFVFKPSRATFDQLMEAVGNSPPTPFAEQVCLMCDVLFKVLIYLTCKKGYENRESVSSNWVNFWMLVLWVLISISEHVLVLS